MAKAVAPVHLNFEVSKTCDFCGETFFRDKRCTWAYWERARFCSRECTGLYNSASAERSRPAKEDAFSRWIEKSGDCWLWTGARDRDGYGIFSYVAKTYRAHVFALELDGRRPRAGEYACHLCNNPPCVNPAHLYPGTPTQNMADAIAAGTTQRGERQHMAKLTDDIVRAIRASSESAGVLAKRYGVTHGAVSMARSGKTWRHVV